jgi:sialic acid synthase SpsE/mannose-6-phosphate isomerase-like protein (cupin superfamily)
MPQLFPTPFFIFDMANNHMGDVEHGVRIIRETNEVCQEFPFHFGFKLQYRHLDSFIHPAYRDRKDIKFVKRFSETRLQEKEFLRLIEEMRRCGFHTVCTPYDEPSVDLLVDHGIEFLKVASCSFTDWPLLERVVRTGKPVIASTAGSSVEELDRVVSFFDHRSKQLALMHCVAEYPTPLPHLQLNQIDLLRSRYPKLPIGFSTHEAPDAQEPVKLAVAKGATLFEKHVGVPSDTVTLNAYSATPAQVRHWLSAAQQALSMCGAEDRVEGSATERKNLADLRRGAYAARAIPSGQKIEINDLLLAIPTQAGQLTANDLSKYVDVFTESPIAALEPVLFSAIKRVDNQRCILDIVARVKELIRQSGVAVPRPVDLEISHHYGLGRFNEYGLTMITVVNREYCKKLIILLADQRHPEQYHKLKEETFHVLFGEIQLTLDGQTEVRRAGDVVTVERGVRHAFYSPAGAIIEEISSTHHTDDSYYMDPTIGQNRNRKTLLTYWLE